MKHVLLINEYFSDNVGDQAIARGLSDVFSSKGYLVSNEGFSRSRARVSSADLERQQGFLTGIFSSSVVLKSIYWFLKNFLRVFYASYKTKGAAVIGGGQLILAGSSFAIAMLTWILALKFFGKRVILLSVGVGERFGYYERCLYKISFAMADDIFIRERVGLARLKKEFNVDARFCPDMAYALFAPVRSISEFKVCTVCVTSYDVHVRYAPELDLPILSREQYWEKWAQSLKGYASQGYAIRFAWTTESDRHETIAFLEFMSLGVEFSFFDRELTLSNVMDELSKADIVIAGRMHALILAEICGCKALPWIVSKKIEIFAAEYLSCDARCLREEISSTVDSLGL
ncbi:polysaccharide pyruvyl transferase family protein [Phytopseudomonas punonensis]|nr:polysaccharide pyruvyl transferase family protein [Pseudomonas punonensis]